MLESNPANVYRPISRIPKLHIFIFISPKHMPLLFSYPIIFPTLFLTSSSPIWPVDFHIYEWTSEKIRLPMAFFISYIKRSTYFFNFFINLSKSFICMFNIHLNTSIICELCLLEFWMSLNISTLLDHQNQADGLLIRVSINHIRCSLMQQNMFLLDQVLWYLNTSHQNS